MSKVTGNNMGNQDDRAVPSGLLKDSKYNCVRIYLLESFLIFILQGDVGPWCCSQIAMILCSDMFVIQCEVKIMTIWIECAVIVSE